MWPHWANSLSCYTGLGHWRGKWPMTWLTRSLPRWWLSRALSSWTSSYCSWRETRNRCSDRDASLRHRIIKIHKPFHQTLLPVCAGDRTNQLRGPHMHHVISKLLTESRGTHHSFFCAHTPQEVTSWRTHAFFANPQEPHILFLTVLLSTSSRNQCTWAGPELTTAPETQV